MKKEYTQEEQDKIWNRYRTLKILTPIVVLAIAGLYFLGKEGFNRYNQNQAEQNKVVQLKKLINSPSEDSHFVFMNRYQYYILKSLASTPDSISFNICATDPDNISWKMIDIFTACQNSSKKITIAKSTLLNAICNEKETRGKFCQAIPDLHPNVPFSIRSAFDFNSVNLRISMGWNTKETKEKEITLINEGLPIQIKEIRSSNGEIKLVSNSIPASLDVDAKISMIVPIEKGFLPNKNYNRYLPFDFQMLISSERNGEEWYQVTFKNNNLTVNKNNLKTN